MQAILRGARRVESRRCQEQTRAWPSRLACRLRQPSKSTTQEAIQDPSVAPLPPASSPLQGYAPQEFAPLQNEVISTILHTKNQNLFNPGASLVQGSENLSEVDNLILIAFAAFHDNRNAWAALILRSV
ncbi:hypothetical protein HG531_009925 [Fusarium graminearum]|nr:hypothetical protein HG531_009925 [Fusarium graminearum]